MKEIYLAGGCFWGVEEYMSRIEGVVETSVGYANGFQENPTYEEVCTGITGHAETVRVVYDEKLVTLDFILSKYWGIINPTLLYRQGPDIGKQYRTGIYYVDEEDASVIDKSLEEEKKKYESPIVTEIEKLKVYYLAEDYHQKYLKKNPRGYCHIDLSK